MTVLFKATQRFLDELKPVYGEEFVESLSEIVWDYESSVAKRMDEHNHRRDFSEYQRLRDKFAECSA